LAAALLLAACTTKAHSNGNQPPPVIDNNNSDCEPGTAGLGGAPVYNPPSFHLPANCTIEQDPNTMQVERRQITVITAEADLDTACHALPEDGGMTVDGGRPMSDIDFTKWELLVVRVPDSVAPQWEVQKDGVITIAENTVGCRATIPTAIRYLMLVPHGATVAFFSCPPTPCNVDPGA
jgi:hypothetical protein